MKENGIVVSCKKDVVEQGTEKKMNSIKLADVRLYDPGTKSINRTVQRMIKRNER